MWIAHHSYIKPYRVEYSFDLASRCGTIHVGAKRIDGSLGYGYSPVRRITGMNVAIAIAGLSRKP